MPKVRRKKYNPHKKMHKLTTVALRKTALVFVGGDNTKVRFVNLCTNTPSNPTKLMVEALSNVQYRWSVLCAVLLRAKDGGEYLQSVEIESKAPEYQRDMVSTLNTHHNKLLKGCNPSDICTIAWLAVPYAHEWATDSTAATLNALGAWDFSAQWEMDT